MNQYDTCVKNVEKCPKKWMDYLKSHNSICTDSEYSEKEMCSPKELCKSDRISDYMFDDCEGYKQFRGFPYNLQKPRRYYL